MPRLTSTYKIHRELKLRGVEQGAQELTAPTKPSPPDSVACKPRVPYATGSTPDAWTLPQRPLSPKESFLCTPGVWLSVPLPFQATCLLSPPSLPLQNDFYPFSDIRACVARVLAVLGRGAHGPLKIGTGIFTTFPEPTQDVA